MEQSKGRYFTDGRSEIAREALLLVSCSCCGKLHPTEQSLEFDPGLSALRGEVLRSCDRRRCRAWVGATSR